MPRCIKVHAILTINFIAINCVFAEVKNGYAFEIQIIRESLRQLNSFAEEADSRPFTKKQEIKRKLRELRKAITYFNLTQKLLDQFRIISPDLYNEIENITNCKGQPVDVYVKLVSENQLRHGATATTNLASAKNDFSVYQSEYGLNTVAVKIATMPRSRMRLAHELGHVKYQVPNLATYLKYYREHYQNSTFKSNYIGHNTSDPSGLKALEFEAIHRNDYSNFRKKTFKTESQLASKNSKTNLHLKAEECLTSHNIWLQVPVISE